MDNKFINSYMVELRDKRKDREERLEVAISYMGSYEADKRQLEKELEEIDEALIALGYKGEEVEDYE